MSGKAPYTAPVVAQASRLCSQSVHGEKNKPLKFADYEQMGIPEYWIADYAGLGGRDFIGNPKQPAFFVCQLIEGEYVKTLFRGNDLIVSPTFPELKLTAQQIFNAGL